jgi:hypothetical protein
MPAPTSDDEKRLRLYLLKLAPEDELDRIEESYLSTSEYEDQISDAENHLVSDYVHDRLSEEEERAFVTSYLVTPERREQVALSRVLGELAQSEEASLSTARQQQSLAGENLNFWQRFLSWITVPSPALAFAVVATAVILVMTNVALFLGWRGQVRQTEVALHQAQALRDAQAKRPEAVVTARVLAIPVLGTEEANLAPGQARKLAFRLPANLPDAVEIPVGLGSLAESAVIDATLSSSGRTVWSESGLKLRGGGSQNAVLRIPFASLQPYLDRPLELQVVERGHAVLATFELRFSKDE